MQQATGTIAQKGLVNPDEAGAASSPYLRMFALVAIGFMWLKMAKVAKKKLAEGSDLSALGRPTYRTFWAWRPVPARVERAIYSRRFK